MNDDIFMSTKVRKLLTIIAFFVTLTPTLQHFSSFINMTKPTQTLTPMMQQFFNLKAKHPDALLLFRCGDFYETYSDDAVEASQLLGITLTQRNNGKNGKADAMAGFPYHALDSYLPKLIRAGKRVAICDQLEDPKLTKKLVKRGITELVTPGVAMTDNVLQNKENNFLCALHFGKASCGVALLDISTGEFLTTEGSYDTIQGLLSNFRPKEVIYNREQRQQLQRHFNGQWATYELDEWVFNETTALQKLLEHFRTRSLKGFGVEHLHEGIVAAGAIMHYLELTLHNNINHITTLSRIEEERFVHLDTFTVRALELIQPMQTAEGTSLLSVIDHTLTPMGARMLKRWILFPLKSINAVNERLDAVECYFRHPQLRDIIAEQLAVMGDMERLVSKIATGRIAPREMVQLCRALTAVQPIQEACRNADNNMLKRIAQQLNTCTNLTQHIEQSIEPAAPLALGKGKVIRDGVNSQLDELRHIAYSGKDYLLTIQQRETENTGIASLKVGYNNVFGYYLEVRNTYKEKVPESWIRKQTLAQAERYITQELKEYEEKILGAEERIAALEAQLYNALVDEARQYLAAIQINASLIAQLDCLLSYATVSEAHHYVRPVVTDDNIIDIRQGRHPVIETQLTPGEPYIPNDIMLNNKQQQIVIITGPNMAGKSALLRQTALITLMAQMGCFVPAEAAHIGMVDKVFTRVGASDNIASGESTFMVEMTEASNILNNATPRSLVLFDELGRGTSTYDGISIAWAIVEYLHEQPRAQARTLFATHYHELNEMAQHFPRIRNYNVAVREADGRVIFLRKLEPGGSEHSFGIHVAEMAGMPKSIVKRANTILQQLEKGNKKAYDDGEKNNEAEISTENNLHPSAITPPKVIPDSNSREGVQLSFFQLDDPVLSQIRDAILNLDINNLTPIEALNKLNDIKRIVGGK